jgi:subtilisin family serine protease
MADEEAGTRPRRRGRRRPPPPAPDTTGSALPQSDPQARETQLRGFVPATLDRSVISAPLLLMLDGKRRILQGSRLIEEPYSVIIDLNLDYPGGQDRAREQVKRLIEQAIATAGARQGAGRQGVNEAKTKLSDHYVFARLDGDVIRELARLDSERGAMSAAAATDEAPPGRAIHRIWPDFPVERFTIKSISTVKADAARIAFSALGDDIVWAVVDSGIQGSHPHFTRHCNLALKQPLAHLDFTGNEQPLEDAFGHGTHVAGIIAGEFRASPDGAPPAERRFIRAYERQRDERGEVTYQPVEAESISGMAPKCKLLSLKVLDDNGDGEASSLITAIEYIQRLNDYGRRIRVHGVNMSVGYSFEPEWFACGQSPLCVEVDRLARTGVVVVVAAGNTGYGWQQSEARGAVSAGLDLTINDPGNAELAITVGSTHRDSPHVYGVSYFSSKGPTGDGRIKPDLVAPGEKIISCAAGKKRAAAGEKVGDVDYLEDSGTSMAAPHVSGVIAAFLSARREFIGQSEDVKQIFLSSATDLKRDRHFQGHGLVDLLRAMQSV